MFFFLSIFLVFEFHQFCRGLFFSCVVCCAAFCFCYLCVFVFLFLLLFIVLIFLVLFCSDISRFVLLCAQVSTLLPTPTVFPSTNIVYLTTSPRLKINGTNFNEKSTALYFSPPLREGTDVSIFVRDAFLTIKSNNKACFVIRPFLTQSDLSVENGLFRVKPKLGFLTTHSKKGFLDSIFFDWGI